MSLSGDDADSLTQYYTKLSQDGTVNQPLTQAPWGDSFGMVSDKFDIDWMVNISPRNNKYL